MGSSKTQDSTSIRTSKNNSHKTDKLDNNTVKWAAFFRKCHMDEPTAVAEKKKIRIV